MREKVFPKTYSMKIVSENRFSGKTYFYTIAPANERVGVSMEGLLEGYFAGADEKSG